MNSEPGSLLTCVGQGYLETHSSSAMFVTVIARLSSYCWISNQLVAGSIIVTHLHIRFAPPFLQMVYGPMRSMHILSQGIASASFSGRCPHFLEVLLRLLS
jgi:hypothetical protein